MRPSASSLLLMLLPGILLAGCCKPDVRPDPSVPLLPPPAILMEPPESPQERTRLERLLPHTSRPATGTPSG